MQASRKNLSVNELLAIKRKEAKDLQAKQVSAAIKVLKTFDDFAPYKNMDEKEFIDEFNDGLYQDFVDSCLLESSGKNQYIFMINLARVRARRFICHKIFEEWRMIPIGV